MKDKDQALLMVLMAAQGTDHPGTRYHRDQCVRLAMQWPSLAAALADLLAAHDYGIPTAFRAARSVLRGEKPNGVELASVAQPPESGEWCFCLMGPDADGRGHLKGEAGCDDDT